MWKTDTVSSFARKHPSVALCSSSLCYLKVGATDRPTYRTCRPSGADATLFSSSPLLRLKGLAPTCLPEKYDLVAPANRRAATHSLSLGGRRRPLSLSVRPTDRAATSKRNESRILSSSAPIVKCRRATTSNSKPLLACV